MRAGNPPLKPQPCGLQRQRFHMAAHRVVAFVTMHINHQASPGGDLAKEAHRVGPRLHGALKMRNAADHIHPHIQRPAQVDLRGRVSENAILRESHELQIKVGGHLLAHIYQRLNASQRIIANINMAANRAEPHAHRQIAIT